MSDTRIGPAEREHHEEHGYVVVPRLFGKGDLAAWRQRLSDIIEGRVAPARHMLVMKDVMVAKGLVKPERRAEAIAKLQDFEEDEVLYGYSTHPALLDCVEALIGPDLMTIHTMLINKPPNVDGRHPLHQDIIYFPFRPAERIVGTWTALEPVTREKGCLVAIPGTHRGPILAHGNPEWENLNLGYFGVRDASDAERRIHFELEPGDTLFFHPHLVHGSGRNRTQGFRRAISTHYASSQCELAPEIRERLEKMDTEEARGALLQRHYLPVRGLPPRAALPGRG